MKLHRKLSFLLILCFGFSVFSAESAQSIKSIAQARPCKPAKVTLTGFLHVSRHGSWISGDPGLNGKGLLITLLHGSATRNEQLLSYLRRPQENLNNTFQATFTGAISCNEHGFPVLNLHSIEAIRVAPILEAG